MFFGECNFQMNVGGKKILTMKFSGECVWKKIF